MTTLNPPHDPATAARLADWGVGPDDDALQVTRFEPLVDPLTWTDPRDRAVLAAVDPHDTGRLDDPGYSASRASFDDRQVVELLILAGWYHAVSYLDAGVRLPAEPGTARFAQHRIDSQHRIEGATP